MPILKPISGHGSVAGIRRYLEKKNRALALDLFNLSWDERANYGEPEENKRYVAWDIEMDSVRESFGHNNSWKGKKARTFKHFVLSPNPEDSISLDDLRELASEWVLKYFEHHQIAIVYHDDNERNIPHAHIVVNSTDLMTGYRLHTDHPEDLNRALQEMAKERGLNALSNEMPKLKERNASVDKSRSRQGIYFGRAEKELMAEGHYSWVGDIRARVALAKNTSRSEDEFRLALAKLGIKVADNSAKARRDDWVFSLVDEPSKKVSGERLGYTFGKQILLNRFERQGAYHPALLTERQIRKRAVNAVKLNDLQDLSRLSSVLETCAKFNVRYLEDFAYRLASLERRGHADSNGYKRLEDARAYVKEKGLMETSSAKDNKSSNKQRAKQQTRKQERFQERDIERGHERSER